MKTKCADCGALAVNPNVMICPNCIQKAIEGYKKDPRGFDKLFSEMTENKTKVEK